MASTSFFGTSQSTPPERCSQSHQNAPEASGTLNGRTVIPLDSPKAGLVYRHLADSWPKHSKLRGNQPISLLSKADEPIELKHFDPLIENVITRCSSTMGRYPKEEDVELFSQSLEEFHQALLGSPNSHTLPIIKKFFEHLDAFVENRFERKDIYENKILKSLLIECYIKTTEKEQSLLNAIKQLEIFDPIEIQRHEGYLTEGITGVFQRKIAERGRLTGLSDEDLLGITFPNVKSVSKIQRAELVEYKVGSRRTKLKVTISENNLTVLQQRAMKSCGQTCVAMLLMDLGIQPDFSQLEGHLTNEDERMEAIKGLNVREIRNHLNIENKQEFLEELRTKIRENGSALIGVDPGSGGHCIICDDISADLETIRIRDPWHGWEVSLDAETFWNAISVRGHAATIQQLQRT